MKKTLLMMLGAVLTLPAMARDFTCEYKGQTLTYTVIDEDAKTCQTKSGYYRNVEDWGSGNNVKGALEIPSEASDGEANFTVVAIGDYAYYCCYGLTSVTIPASVTSIGNHAFDLCTSLISVNIPEGVTTIGRSAFSGSSLISVNIPQGVTSISNSAFSLCSSLTSVTISEGVTSIGYGAFEGCSSLTSINIPGSVTSIDGRAFSSTSLTSVNIPKGVTSIGEQAFRWCNSLLSVIISGANVKIAYGAFADCSNNNIKCAYPNSMQNPFPANFHAMSYPKNAIISENMIYGPDGKSVLFVAYNEDGDYSVPSSVTAIEDDAYRYLPNMTTININNDVTSIGNHAFADCETLENVFLPMKLETLGSAVFENSGNIKNVVFNGPTPVEGTADVFDSKVYEDATLYVRSGRQTLFMAVSPWKFFYNITDKEFVGVEEIAADFNADEPCEIYNLSGVKVGSDLNGLTSGLYIVRQGNAVKKIAVK